MPPRIYPTPISPGISGCSLWIGIGLQRFSRENIPNYDTTILSEIFLPQLFRRRLLACGQDRQQTLHTCYFWQAASAGVQSTAPAHSKCAYTA